MDDFEATIYFPDEIELHHSEESDESEEEIIHADEEAPEGGEEEPSGEGESEGKTVEAIISTMNDDQKKVLGYLVGEALAEGGGEEEPAPKGEENSEVEHSEKGEDNTMAYNVFDEESRNANVLTHGDMVEFTQRMRPFRLSEEDVLIITGDFGFDWDNHTTMQE